MHLGNGIDDFHALDHLAENRIPNPPRRRITEIQKRVILVINKELAGRAVRHIGAGHGHGAAKVFQAIGRFVLNRCLGGLFRQVRRHTAALDHKAFNDAMKNRIGIKAVLDIPHKVFNRRRRLFRIQFQDDLALGGQDFDNRVICLGFRFRSLFGSLDE